MRFRSWGKKSGCGTRGAGVTSWVFRRGPYTAPRIPITGGILLIRFALPLLFLSFCAGHTCGMNCCASRFTLPKCNLPRNGAGHNSLSPDTMPMAKMRDDSIGRIYVVGSRHCRGSQRCGDSQERWFGNHHGLFGKLTATAMVEVREQTKPDPIRFRSEVLAGLTKQGCNSGSCHGSPQGKGGFSLSLFGYAPEIDAESLVRGALNRRVNRLEPNASLMLKKPTLRVAHVGGKRLSKSDVAYDIFRNWIAEGANTDDRDALRCNKIVVYPGPSRILHFPNVTQTLNVIANFSDGSTRDITSLATYEVSHKEIIRVDASGLVTGLKRGQCAVRLRYLEHLESVFFTVIEDVPGFVWKDFSETNYVDHWVHAKLKQLQVLPSETCNDSTFVRRVHLDLTGLLPSVEESRAFLADKSADKSREEDRPAT